MNGQRRDSDQKAQYPEKNIYLSLFRCKFRLLHSYYSITLICHIVVYCQVKKSEASINQYPTYHPQPAGEQDNGDNANPAPLDGNKAAQSNHGCKPVKTGSIRKQDMHPEPDRQI